jgi:hypothetical protein
MNEKKVEEGMTNSHRHQHFLPDASMPSKKKKKKKSSIQKEPEAFCGPKLLLIPQND